ncbi:MAG: response regulator [Lachnospiraceae bacterium]
MADNQIRIIITDDHALIREGLKQLLEFDGDISVIEEAANGEECIEKIVRYNPDVLLLDINMPKKNGIEVLENIRDRGLNQKVIILTVHNEVEYMLKAMDLGVNGYILKDSCSSEIKQAIYTVMKGDVFIQKELVPILNSKLLKRDIDKEKIKSLTNRELEILKLVSHGQSNKDLASALNISERTVKNHLSNLFKKIDVEDRTQAAVFAIKNDLVEIY